MVNVDDDTLDRYETALRLVVEQSRASSSRAESDLLDGLPEFIDEELEHAVDGYLRESAAMEAELLGGREDSVEPPDASAAWSRAAALFGGDMLVAWRLAEVAALEAEPSDLDAGTLDLRDSVPSVVARVLRADLGDDDAVAIVMAALRGQEPVYGGAGTPGFDEVTAAMDKILDTSAAVMAKALGTAVPSVMALDEIMGLIGAADAAGVFANARRRAAGFFRRIVRKMIDVFEAGVKKLAALFGVGSIDELIDQAKDGLRQLHARWKGSMSPGEVLGRVLGSDSLRDDYRRAFDALPEEARAGRAAEATRVATELSNRVSHVGLAVNALAVAGAMPFGAVPPGSVVIAVVGLAVAAYVFWAAHDHLDALRFGLLPDRAVGLRRVLM